MTELNPAWILFAGALILPLLTERLRCWTALLVPLLGLAQLLSMAHGSYGQVQFMNMDLTLTRLDALSYVWALIFLVAAIIAAIYALHLRDTVQQVAALVYAGAAIGAVLAGDLLTLFVYWELTAVSSVFLIWAARNRRAYRAGMRYLVVQIGSGVLLLAGVVLHWKQTGSIEFGTLGLSGPGSVLIFLAFGIKCAFPLLHNWLQDAYPEGTVTGTVILSVYTTKLAVYCLARGYAGTDILIPIGALMTVFPIFFAVIENDLRRVLAYSLNNQLGFMVVGVGLGTELALNGTAAHAFSHILYKALLFMSMGAVLYRVGTIKASELGGLYKSMPRTAAFCIVGSLSISAFPLFSGFVSKSLILAAAAEQGHWLLWLVLLFASAGVLDHSGIKIPFFSFFAHDSGRRCQEAPRHMLWAMGLTSALCIGIGIWPQALYDILPYQAAFTPYTYSHVITQMQLLMFAALAFAVLMRSGLYPAEIPALNIDSDWLYRKLLPAILQRGLDTAGRAINKPLQSAERHLHRSLNLLYRHHGPHGILARSWPTGSMVLWVAVLLAALVAFDLMSG